MSHHTTKYSPSDLIHRFITCAAMTGLCLSVGLAVETSEVSLGEDGIYDGAVKITRTIGGEMMLEDGVTTGMTLAELAAPASAHDVLTGLDADDHPQYQNVARHILVHTAEYNDDLSIAADVGGNSTLGDHAGDSSIHLRTDQAEEVAGAWSFAGTISIREGVLFSDGGTSGDVELFFMDGETTPASLTWSNESAEFLVNRDASFQGVARAESYAIQSDGSVLTTWLSGPGTPEGSVTAPVGSLYTRTDGAGDSTLYVKESGIGATGWSAK